MNETDKQLAEAGAAPPQQVIERDARGHFIKGQSGNPAGRTKGQKNRSKELQVAHELALREYMSDPAQQQKVLDSLDNIFRIAAGGTVDAPVENNHAVSAAKLVFDRLMPKSSGGDAQKGGAPTGVHVTIENNTGHAGIGPGGITIDVTPDDDD